MEDEVKVKSFQRRKCCYPSLVLVIMALIAVGLFLLDLTGFFNDPLFMSLTDDEDFQVLKCLSKHGECYLSVFILLGMLAVGVEVRDRFRFPPAKWRMKGYLIETLGDLGCIDVSDKDKLESQIHFFKMLTWKPTKSVLIRFNLQNGKQVNSEALERCLRSKLPHCNDVELRPYEVNGHTLGYELDFRYSEETEDLPPWQA